MQIDNGNGEGPSEHRVKNPFAGQNEPDNSFQQAMNARVVENS